MLWQVEGIATSLWASSKELILPLNGSISVRAKDANAIGVLVLLESIVLAALKALICNLKALICNRASKQQLG